MPRGIADERDSADRTVTPTGNKTKMNGFVEISTLLIHSAPKQKSNEWMHLSPFYTRMHGEWLRYAKSTSQFHWRFLLVRDVRGFQVNPLCRHDITRSDRQIGNLVSTQILSCSTLIIVIIINLSLAANQHIIITSEGSGDTEDCSNDCKNISFICYHRNKLHFKTYSNKNTLNCKNK